ncbi:myosin-11-like isoform X3 [Cucurbita moschata]|uniref:Myosin-11-like isoform X3 n=1 Tax=Cucurbita moschata TaxID=3662 RepID=A0A6J1HGM0_CUCMO|nr:myosin-11-like isoform X3 [Cucurbita moschata]
MSWLRAAVIKAVEASSGRKDNLTRTVRNYAGSVAYHAGNAVVGGAKIIQDRIGRNMQGFKQAVKRLEEISVSSRGPERVQLLRRWLIALKEVDRLSSGSVEGGKNSPTDQLNDENKDSPKRPALVYYLDPDMGSELRTFRDVFLTSQALEGITLSMILEEPNDEEESLLLEIYGLCLSGGKEVRQAVMTSVHTLAKAFSEYQDEVLVKRDELLQYVQDAISGLKINADFDRIDAKACSVKEKLDEKQEELTPSSGDHDNTFDNGSTTSKILQEILSRVQLCSKLEELLVKKKLFNDGNSAQLHAEKELTDEIGDLENQKDQLEAELKKVNALLSAARMRLHNAKEEREHFDEASNQILVHLKTKEDELFRSVASYKVEANAVNACKTFLEHTWNLQTSQRQQKEENVNGELEKYGDYFVKLVTSLLTSYKGKLEPSLSCIRILEENLSSMKGSDAMSNIDDRDLDVNNERKKLEEEYLDIESKFVSTLSTVDTVRMQFYDTKGVVRNLGQRVQELFDALEKIKKEFESIKRPRLLIETFRQKPELRVKDRIRRTSSLASVSKQTAEVRRSNYEEMDDSSLVKRTKNFSMEAEIAKLDSDEGMDTYDSIDEINDWEFDELGRDYDAPSNHQRI